MASKYVKDMFESLLEVYNIHLDNYNDSGLLLYDVESQEVFSGGSGTGCIALVSLGYIYEILLEGKINKVLLIATGALLNPIMTYQKETIPGIAHAIVLERV